MIPSAVDAGLVAGSDETGLDVSAWDENLEAPGVVDGQAYGVPLGGSNTLGLMYNPTIIEAAGVDVSTITDWDSLNAAIKKVVDVIWMMSQGTGTSRTLATWAYSMAFGKGTSMTIKYSEASVLGTILIIVALIFGLIYLRVQKTQETC